MGGILYLRVRFLSLLSRGKNPSSHTPCDLHIFRFNGYSIGVGHIPKVRGQTGLLALSQAPSFGNVTALGTAHIINVLTEHWEFKCSRNPTNSPSYNKKFKQPHIPSSVFFSPNKFCHFIDRKIGKFFFPSVNLTNFPIFWEILAKFFIPKVLGKQFLVPSSFCLTKLFYLIILCKKISLCSFSLCSLRRKKRHIKQYTGQLNISKEQRNNSFILFFWGKEPFFFKVPIRLKDSLDGWA